MKRAYIAPVVDLSLPLDDGEKAARALGDGLRALLAILEREPAQRVEVALAGAVTQALLRWGQERALQVLAERASAGQVSFLATACWGAFLPLVPAREAARQLDLNERVNRDALGEWVYRADGLFPPQLGYSRSVAELAFARGLPQILADALAWRGGAQVPRDRHFALQGHAGFHVFFVDRALSQALDAGRLDPETIHRIVAPRRSGYAVVRIPGRTLAPGSGPLRLLAALYGRTPTVAALLEEILALFPEVETVEPIACALGTEPGELASGVQFAKWSAPGNELQALLWRLAQIASDEAFRLDGEEAGGAIRAVLDESLDCSAWRFASGKPELDPRRTAAGGLTLISALRAGGGRVLPERREEAEEIHERLRRLCDLRVERTRLAASPPSPA